MLPGVRNGDAVRIVLVNGLFVIGKVDLPKSRGSFIVLQESTAGVLHSVAKKAIFSATRFPEHYLGDRFFPAQDEGLLAELSAYKLHCLENALQVQQQQRAWAQSTGFSAGG